MRLQSLSIKKGAVNLLTVPNFLNQIEKYFEIQHEKRLVVGVTVKCSQPLDFSTKSVSHRM